jgi:hypothetical protein
MQTTEFPLEINICREFVVTLFVGYSVQSGKSACLCGFVVFRSPGVFLQHRRSMVQLHLWVH